jgi:flagellar protein FliS
MIANPAQAYRQYAANGASPLGLILMLYEVAVTSLHRAVQAVEIEDIPGRTASLNHVLAVIGELQSALDFERGGEVAQNLERFYLFARSRVIEASSQNSKDILQQLAAQFLSLREAWQQVESASTASPHPSEIPSRPLQAPPPPTGSEASHGRRNA